MTDLSCCGDGGALGLANGLGGLVLVFDGLEGTAWIF